MSDGYKSVVAASRKDGRPYLLDFDNIPSSWVDVAFAIDYGDFKGKKSTRWVTYRKLDGKMLYAYCWVKKELRSFSLGRIENVIDQNGEARPIESLFPSALGYRQAETDYRQKRDASRGYGRSDQAGDLSRTGSGFAAFSSAVDGDKNGARNENENEPGLITKIFSVLFLLLILFGLYKLLFWIF